MMFKLFQLIMYVCFFLLVLTAMERLPDVGTKLYEAYETFSIRLRRNGTYLQNY
jgi:hypothetical protein